MGFKTCPKCKGSGHVAAKTRRERPDWAEPVGESLFWAVAGGFMFGGCLACVGWFEAPRSLWVAGGGLLWWVLAGVFIFRSRQGLWP